MIFKKIKATTAMILLLYCSYAQQNKGVEPKIIFFHSFFHEILNNFIINMYNDIISTYNYSFTNFIFCNTSLFKTNK
jgi:hypothetical protein